MYVTWREKGIKVGTKSCSWFVYELEHNIIRERLSLLRLLLLACLVFSPSCGIISSCSSLPFHNNLMNFSRLSYQFYVSLSCVSHGAIDFPRNNRSIGGAGRRTVTFVNMLLLLLTYGTFLASWDCIHKTHGKWR